MRPMALHELGRGPAPQAPFSGLSGGEPAAEETALAVRGEDEDGDRRVPIDQHLRRLEAVHAGHAHVHDHDVRLAPLGERDGALAVGSLPDHADPGRPRERQPQAFADDLVVVDDQTGDLWLAHRGKSIVLTGLDDQVQIGRMADWVTISALATAGGTLVLSPGSGRSSSSPRRTAAARRGRGRRPECLHLRPATDGRSNAVRHWQVDRADPR